MREGEREGKGKVEEERNGWVNEIYVAGPREGRKLEKTCL